jgi:hypothetical protein
MGAVIIPNETRASGIVPAEGWESSAPVPAGFISSADAAKMIGIPDSVLRNMRTLKQRNADKGPQFFRVGNWRVCYRDQDIRTYMERKAARIEAQAAVKAAKLRERMRVNGPFGGDADLAAEKKPARDLRDLELRKPAVADAAPKGFAGEVAQALQTVSEYVTAEQLASIMLRTAEEKHLLETGKPMRPFMQERSRKELLESIRQGSRPHTNRTKSGAVKIFPPTLERFIFRVAEDAAPTYRGLAVLAQPQEDDTAALAEICS